MRVPNIANVVKTPIEMNREQRKCGHVSILCGQQGATCKIGGGNTPLNVMFGRCIIGSSLQAGISSSSQSEGTIVVHNVLEPPA